MVWCKGRTDAKHVRGVRLQLAQVQNGQPRPLIGLVHIASVRPDFLQTPCGTRIVPWRRSRAGDLRGIYSEPAVDQQAGTGPFLPAGIPPCGPRMAWAGLPCDRRSSG